MYRRPMVLIQEVWWSRECCRQIYANCNPSRDSSKAVVYIDSELMYLMDYYDEDLNEDQSTAQWLLNGVPVSGATEETRPCMMSFRVSLY